MKQLEEHARKLAMLFDDPEPGLATWNEAVRGLARDVHNDVNRLESRPTSPSVPRKDPCRGCKHLYDSNACRYCLDRDGWEPA